MNVNPFNVLIKYATTISLIIQPFYYANIVPYSSSIMLLNTCVFVGGFYINYIKPKYIYVPEYNYKVTGKFAKILDILFHHLPLFFFSDYTFK